MSDIENIINRACIIVNGIAFEVIECVGHSLMILATDLDKPENRASFTKAGNNFILSASSFKDNKRECILLDAVNRNTELLMEEMVNAEILEV